MQHSTHLRSAESPNNKKISFWGSFHINNKLFLYLFFIYLTILCLFPIYLALVNGSRSSADIMANPLVLIPGHALFDNHNVLMAHEMNVWKAMWNSFIVAIPTTIISAYFSTLAGFALAKHQFPARGIIFAFVLITLMIPAQLSFIGYYDLMSSLGLEDTHWSLIIPAFYNGAFIFFTKQYIETAIHDELIEAAIVDGATNMQIFHRLIFPIAAPAVATMSIFTFVTSWNNLFAPLIMISSSEKQLLPVFISQLRDPVMGQEFGAIYLALAISIIPLALAFLFLSRFIIAGMSQGAVKG